MTRSFLVSTVLVATLASACTPTQKKVGAGTLALGSASLAVAGVGAFVEGQCPSDPYESCDTQPLMHGLGLTALLGAAVLATGAGLLYRSAKNQERRESPEVAPAPAPAAHATFGGLPVAAE